MLMLMASVVFVCVYASPESTLLPSAMIYVHKCCPMNESLWYGRECLAETESINNDWLDGKLTVSGEALPVLHYKPNTTISRCDRDNIDMIFMDVNSLHISLLDDGSLRLTQDIQNVTIPVGSFCIDHLPNDTAVILACPCSTSIVCVQKCCHPPFILSISGDDDTDATARCQMPPDDSVNYWSQEFWKYETDNSRPLYEMHGYPKCEVEASHYIVDKQRNYHWNAIRDLHVENSGGLQLSDFGSFAPRSFCADLAVWSSTNSNSVSFNVIACRLPLSPTTKQNIYGVLYIVGTVSLILTVLVHVVVPQLRKTAQAYIMIAYCTSLALAYVSHSIIIFAGIKIQGTFFCRLLGLIIQGGFLAAFIWLNVMCIDIASTFRGLHLSKNNGRTQKGKTFVVYCFYVYGITALIILMTIISQHLLPGGPALIFSNESCWFDGMRAATIFFFLPLGISQIINIVLFISTALKIYKAQRQTAILSRDGSGRHTGKKPYSSQDKRRFILYVKLFFLMGLTWAFEVISATVDKDNVLWCITDMINMLSGVIIFAMFCCKKKVFKLLLNTIKCSKATKNNSQKAPASQKMSGSYSTRSSSVNVYNIGSAYRNEVSTTSSANYTMSYL